MGVMVNELIIVGDILDSECHTYELNQRKFWHKYGHKILSYGNPQVGVENPEIYRRNYRICVVECGI